MPRHRQLVIDEEIPEWIDTSDDYCMRSVAEDAYTAKAWADKYGAKRNPGCRSPYQAALKSLKRMNNVRLSTKERASEGSRAARKFWEAKVCAREKIPRQRFKRASKRYTGI